MNASKSHYLVVSVQGRDQKGVVAKFATYMASHGINIEDTHQQVVRGLFVMDMLVCLDGATISTSNLTNELKTLGQELNMEVRVANRKQRELKRLVILASKEPHCLRELGSRLASGEMKAECVAVLANHPDLEPLAARFGFHFECFPAGSGPDEKQRHFAWLANRLEQLKSDVVVLARYMQILPENIICQFENQIINIHPSLLPHFPGANPYRQAFESGVRVTGCTAHFVTKDLDQGPIILQDVFHIQVGKDTAADVRERGLNAEANILCRAVEYFLNEEIVVANGQVVFKAGITSFAEPAK